MKYAYNSFMLLCLSVFFLLQGCVYDFTIGPWENGVVPFYCTGDFSDEDRRNIDTAMKTWEGVCGVYFEEVIPRSSAYQIIYINENTWSSTIGENNSRCQMSFGNSGEPLEHIIHELGHCLGLIHEHQRPDRTIMWKFCGATSTMSTNIILR